MGSAKSKNVIDTAVNSFISVANTTAQSCSASTTGGNLMNIGNIYGKGDVIIKDLTQRNVAVVSVKCLQDARNDTTVENQFKQVAEQQAKAIADFLSLSKSKATNINKLTANLGQAIKNEYFQNCASQGTGTNTLNVGITPAGAAAPIMSEGTVVLAGITQENIINALTECTQKSKSVTDAKNALEQEINQNTEAQSRGPLSFLNDFAAAFGNLFTGFTGIIIGVVIFIVVLAIIGLVIFLIIKLTKKKPPTGPNPDQQVALLPALGGLPGPYVPPNVPPGPNPDQQAALLPALEGLPGPYVPPNVPPGQYTM